MFGLFRKKPKYNANKRFNKRPARVKTEAEKMNLVKQFFALNVIFLYSEAMN